MNKLIVVAVVAGVFALIYWSPHRSCVRALVEDKTIKVTEADAHLYCARLEQFR